MCLAAVRRLEDEVRDKNVVVILCGGNIDVNVLGRVIERGLAADADRLRPALDRLVDDLAPTEAYSRPPAHPSVLPAQRAKGLLSNPKK